MTVPLSDSADLYSPVASGSNDNLAQINFEKKIDLFENHDLKISSYETMQTRTVLLNFHICVLLAANERFDCLSQG